MHAAKGIRRGMEGMNPLSFKLGCPSRQEMTPASRGVLGHPPYPCGSLARMEHRVWLACKQQNVGQPCATGFGDDMHLIFEYAAMAVVRGHAPYYFQAHQTMQQLM